MCCLQGDVDLPLFRPLPNFLIQLLRGTNQRGKRFRTEHRHYNNMFAFTSVQCGTTFRGLPLEGLMDFQIQGALFHLTGPLQREGIEPEQFAQLYFYDHAQGADIRCILNEQHDETFIREFTAFLPGNNPLIEVYETAKERFQESEATMEYRRSFGGDFAQILPVVRRGKRPQIIEACLQRSQIWAQLSVRCLTENMRVAGLDRENHDFVSWLQDLSCDPAFHGFIAPPPSINTTPAIADFYTRVYPDDLLQNEAMDTTVFADRCILSALNKGVNDINRIMIRRYPGELKEFHAVATPEDAENAPPLSPELLQELNFPSIPPANPELEIGPPVILLQNMDPEHGFCNRLE
jgi:hypothetical protein